MVSNTPLRRYKQQTHGGGIRDPLIISWPNGLPARGEIRRQFAHAIDVAPTLLELAGLEHAHGDSTDGSRPMDGASFASVLRDDTQPPARSTQYFEMLGNRGIWHDGWKAVTHHQQGVDFDDDRWELYHLDADFSEAHDLAGTEPERLDALVELWWREAERNHVLPLDDRILERFLVAKPRPITDRRVFTYFGPLRIPTDSMPDVRNVSYRIVAEVERVAGDEGVLVACGDRFSGYALFVHRDRLVHDYNAAGRHFVIESTVPVPEGRVQLAYEFVKTGHLVGTGRLWVDGQVAGDGSVGPTLARRITPVGMSVGSNVMSPVSDRYDSPFPFGGRIRAVRYFIGDDGG
jgi:arylsulfatase